MLQWFLMSSTLVFIGFIASQVPFMPRDMFSQNVYIERSSCITKCNWVTVSLLYLQLFRCSAKCLLCSNIKLLPRAAHSLLSDWDPIKTSKGKSISFCCITCDCSISKLQLTGTATKLCFEFYPVDLISSAANGWSKIDLTENEINYYIEWIIISRDKLYLLIYQTTFSFQDSRQRRCLTLSRSWAAAVPRSPPPPLPRCPAPWPRSSGARASPPPPTSWSSSSGQTSPRRSLASWPPGPRTPRASHAGVTSTLWPLPRYWPRLDMTEGEMTTKICHYVRTDIKPLWAGSVCFSWS